MVRETGGDELEKKVRCGVGVPVRDEVSRGDERYAEEFTLAANGERGRPA